MIKTIQDFLVELSRLRGHAYLKHIVAWAETQPDTATLWATCQRGEWMLWLAGQYVGEPWSDVRKPLVLAACGCARLVLPICEQRDFGCHRTTISCLDIHEAWARGEPVLRERMVSEREAAYAYSASLASDAAAASVALRQAAAAASAAAAVASAAAAPAYSDAAFYAVAATYRAVDAYCAINAETATSLNVLAQCADIVRKHYPTLDSAIGMK